jgi:outer membrane protein assembly factor BamD
MAWEIGRNNLDKAGDHYSSLASEHFASSLLKEATLMMADAHIDKEEHLLANFYLDEYIKRYGNRENSDRVNFLKLIADYKGIRLPMRDQRLIMDTALKSREFADRFGSSELAIYALTLNTKIRLAQAELYASAAKLYAKNGKEKAAAMYGDISRAIPIDEGSYESSRRSWVRQLFE